MLPFPQDLMLAKAVKTLPVGRALPGGCVYEPKFDGYRGLLFIDQGGCRVQSRGGHDITTGFADIAIAATDGLPSGVILDGELVVWGDGALDFTELQRRLAIGQPKVIRRRRPASFVAFDMLEAEGTDLRSYPLHVRRRLLETVLEGVGPPIQLVPQTADVDEARAWLKQYADMPVGIEGVVIKGQTSRYVGGKRGWSKLRIRDTAEAIIAGVIGSVLKPKRLVLALLDENGRLVFAGTTTELNARQRAEVAPLLEKPSVAVAHPWDEAQAQRGIGRWGTTDREPFELVRPIVVAEISPDTSVDRGRWRHAMPFVRVRPDLTPAEVGRSGRALHQDD